MNYSPTINVWRYMSFASFVNLISRKRLWLSNVDYFGDKWEIIPNINQTMGLISAGKTSTEQKDIHDKIYEKVEILRKNTYINCWSANENESYALWKTFCPSSEGIAIKTTYDRLIKSVTPIPIIEVKYEEAVTPFDKVSIFELIAQKRPMYEHEHEIRIVQVSKYRGKRNDNSITIGKEIPWDPEQNLDSIWIHPEANQMFSETVQSVVKIFAPKLASYVWFSRISYAPPR